MISRPGWLGAVHRFVCPGPILDRQPPGRLFTGLQPPRRLFSRAV